jgi:hypothetical protein
MSEGEPSCETRQNDKPKKRPVNKEGRKRKIIIKKSESIFW